MDISKITPWLQNWMFEDGEKQIELSKVAGGLVLPLGRNPGFGLLVAMEKCERVGFPALAIHSLAEFEESDTDALIRRALDLSTRLRVGEWYGNTLCETNMAILETWNRQQATKHGPQFSLRAAPMLKRNNAADCFQYATRRVRERRTAGRTTLDFTATPKIPAALLSVPPECATGQGIENHPAVAALCFVLAALDFYCLPQVGPEEAYTDDSSRSYWWRKREGNKHD